MNKKVALFLTVLFFTQTVSVRAFGPSRAMERAEEGKQKREERQEQHLSRRVDSALAHLQRWRDHLERMPLTNEEARNQALAEIDQIKEQLTKLREEVATAETPEQLRETARKLHEYWEQHRIRVRKFVGLVLADRVERVIKQTEKIYVRLEQAVDQAEKEGKNVAQARELLANLRKKLNLAEEKVQLAREKFKAIASPTEANQLFREGHQLLKEAHRYLREFKQGMNEVTREIK